MSRTDQASKPSPDMVAEGGKYLTFQVDGVEYGVEILKVQEIIGIQTITRVPKAPHSVRGVINLRGRVIPVLDLRRHFSLEDLPSSARKRMCIVVLRIERDGIQTVIGVLVDTVSEVVEIAQGDIELPVDFRERTQTGFLKGMGKVEERVILLLNIDRVVTTGMLGQILSMSGQKKPRATSDAASGQEARQ